ncbi:class I SAM-dependent DNA methyltransferase [Rhizobium leguminosarum]|uniref:class I SAM-dependent DNA methyltransferase n=1 Tax=Rhizobium leguminosarum TaxID=384 RepID=UPI0010315911|nr:class I SAM-dependent DNA methyltransferase [Rhizobium leguminosarum]TAU22554.1 class I SAM-dependent DNA methyltransferase [Rhizobium leguminosarum]TAU42550.1 class I SAM-dependent DNA methyltransferase [Rhizobium leguminosarum]
MTPHEFLTKWRANELKERSASQSHFNDLCKLLGILDPVSADPTGEWFTFEKGATKTSGGEGWADVWRKGCFAWEYKGRHANLDKANAQLLQYAVALENPPLLIVSDMARIVIRTNWTNSVQEKHEFALEDLVDGAVRDRIKAAFVDPEAFRPKKSRQELTEETAAEFARLAQRLRERGHEAHQVAHFVNRLVFCMFAEDVGLLPDNLFTKMLEVSRRNPAEFSQNAATLFGAMARPGGKVGFTAIEWFNGGLFEDDAVLPMDADDIDQLLRAARRDWSQIDPSILGTLFERGLDPAKRSQLGAHYTDRDKIMMIVRPVIIEQLEAEWAEALARMAALVDNAPRQTKEKLLRGAELAKRTRALAEATAIHETFVERLANFRVLDPACGSGNFLYVALRALKDIEHRANLDAEALGLPRGFPRVGPECVLGIELNPYAAELARVSVWIGEIQWMRRNGFDAAKNPILRPLDTIECRDAVLSDDGAKTEWPEADVVIGNPPFLGNKKMIAELGEDYTRALRKAWPEVSGGVDLVCYWFAKAWAMMGSGRLQRAGLVSTNSIRGGANREVLKPVVEHGRIFDAWSDEGWTVDGASVRVSLVCFTQQAEGRAALNGKQVNKVHADLTGQSGGTDLTSANRLPQNRNVAFQGPVKVGPFDVEGDLARRWLQMPVNPNGRSNGDVVRPLLNGLDITRRTSDRWIVDFGTASEADSAMYEAPFEHILATVKPLRDENRRDRRRLLWWQHGETVPGIKRAIAGRSRAIFTPRVAKHRLFVWAGPTVVPDSAVVIVARDDDTTFGILHSRFHELWSLRMGTFLGVGNDPRYTPSTTFETFPFPEGLTPAIPPSDYAAHPHAQAIAATAARLNQLRESWLNPADLVLREPEVVPGYPDRILSKDEDAAKELKKRTLTSLYNARPQWLANAHAALDAAVADAYGWGDDWRAGLTDDEILARLFRLNQQRASTSRTDITSPVVPAKS